MKRQDYINWDEYFMGVALLAARRSKDPSTQVGACIVDDNNIILSTGDACITHTMTCLVEIQWGAAWLEAWVPNGIAILDIEIAAIVVHRNVVVAITGDTAEFGIHIETISTGSV